MTMLFTQLPTLNTVSTILSNDARLRFVPLVAMISPLPFTVPPRMKAMILCLTMLVRKTRIRSALLLTLLTGESEGLEFLFDQCNPDRRYRGPHYITPRKTYRHKRLTQGARKLAPRLPHRAIQQELVKCFFHHVWPVMPIINASEFLDAFENDMSSISPLLLWSVFFSALNVSPYI